MHPTASSKEPTLADWASKHYPEVKNVGDSSTLQQVRGRPEQSRRAASGGQAIQTRPGIVHRLDRDTSGIILIAKNQQYFNYLKNLFQTRAIRKTYRALVYGKLALRKGVIEKDVKVKSGTTRRTVFKGRGERVAVTEYRVLKYFNPFDKLRVSGFTWVEVKPLTGRTHQIRVHFASIGHPVVGDKLYSFKRHLSTSEIEKLGVKRQMLHAYSLEFSPSPGKRLKLAANLPEDMREVLRNLKVAKN